MEPDKIKPLDAKLLKYMINHKETNFKDLDKRFGRRFSGGCRARLAELKRMGMITYSHDRWWITLHGARFVDDFQYERELDNIARLISFCAGVASGVIVTLIVQWLPKSL
jgi:hypothetical protein